MEEVRKKEQMMSDNTMHFERLFEEGEHMAGNFSATLRTMQSLEGSYNVIT